MHLIITETTPYNEITVYETKQLFGRMGRFRCLRFGDEAVQGAIDLRNTERIVLEYPRAIMHLMDHNIPSFERVFMIGHGIGTIPSQYPDRAFTIAEIDERVAAVSRKFFNYQKDNIVIGDGREWLEKQNSSAFDYVILDAFNQAGTPCHLTTVEFARIAKDRLRSHGILLMNVAGKTGKDWRANSIRMTLAEVFHYTASFFLPESLCADIGNLLLAGSDRPIAADLRQMAGFRERSLENGSLLSDKPR